MSLFTGHDLTCIRGERRVFAGLRFALDPGGALLLQGANGSGKTSLLRLMAGLGRPAEGRIRWHDVDIADDCETHNARLHFVGHGDTVKPALSARENIAFWTDLRGGGDVEGALSAFGLGPLAAVPGRFLSAGQRRRVNLARLAAAPAALWLLDEPATALDSDSVARLRDAIARHRAGGGSVALSSHGGLDIPDAVPLDLTDFAEAAA
ncbi:MAG: heme ABC exporter ATP-binding protein CcmA [Rhodospirillales bacterium]|nr:heme ABC exporter ATP-binding protein CcmA [Rhodospirillales bacterium]MSP81124.1 heme ABC exporter ATP-binding protein CcmA [Rhodospirillales bacterium]